MSTVSRDSNLLVFIARLVVLRQVNLFLAAALAENHSAIPQIGVVAHIIHDHGDNRAGSGLVYHLLRFSLLQKLFLCLAESVFHGENRVSRERLLLDDEVVEIVSQELGAHRATVPVVNRKKGTVRPDLAFGPLRRLHHIEDYGHPVFVVVPYEALVRVSWRFEIATQCTR